ncbi:gamma-glutamylcyclotransferase family protein [Pelistega europaea]|uniref:Gamma-glutamylcyclotransferase n=1 Tax=Pelistega europaea TaxID=106147 RepID=A0A7Y4L9S4_9BURK|nr:gamma-glutamylcyclotransferase family protein [Pelistega europaea]NOL48546.1 gamma-glutamylcyclotransferase [Pelistega europaea]
MYFPLFVYGTLKKGFANYARHCAGAVKVETACCWGRLYSLDAGYPAMEVPPHTIQAIGSTAYVLDGKHKGKMLSFEQPEGDWDQVQGELMYFAHPDKEIPLIDELEEYHPDKKDNLYERVFITVKTEDALVNAWTYVMKDVKMPGHRVCLNQEGVAEWTNSDSGYIGETQTAASLL